MSAQDCGTQTSRQANSFATSNHSRGTVVAMEKHERLRWARRQRFSTAAAAVEALGISKGTFAGHEAGTRDFDNEAAELYARRFGVPFAWLALGQGPLPKDAPAGTSAPAAEPAEVRLAPDAPQLFPGEWPRDVPVMGVTVGGEDADFEMNGEIVDYVRRPPGIANRKGVYALHVLGTSMYPRYEEGELIYVDGSRVPSIGDYGVFQVAWPGGAEGRADQSFVKKLEKRSPSKVTLLQFNPAKTFDFNTRDVRSQHRVIPWAEVLGY